MNPKANNLIDPAMFDLVFWVACFGLKIWLGVLGSGLLSQGFSFGAFGFGLLNGGF